MARPIDRESDTPKPSMTLAEAQAITAPQPFDAAAFLAKAPNAAAAAESARQSILSQGGTQADAASSARLTGEAYAYFKSIEPPPVPIPPVKPVQPNVSGVGGGYTGSMPGGNTGFSGGFTQAQIDAAFASGKAETAKTAAEDAYRNKVKASDKLIAQLAKWGIDDPNFSKFISSEILADVSTEDFLIKLPEQEVYKRRFPGMAALSAKSRAITEDAYMKLETQMVQTLRFFDLPTGFYDNREQLGKIIGGDVSPKELQDRVQMAQDLSKSANNEIRNSLKQFYNVGEGDITAYFINPEVAEPILMKRAKAAQIAGIGKTSGFAGFQESEAMKAAQNSAYGSLNETELTNAFSKAQAVANVARRLSSIDNEIYSDREALQATIEQNQESILASQRRAARETSRFSGQSGLTSSSLKTQTNI